MHIYNDSLLAVCIHPGGVENRITFSSGDGVLGAGTFDETPLFFSSHHGVVSLASVVKYTPDNSMTTLNDSLAARLSDSLNVSGES